MGKRWGHIRKPPIEMASTLAAVIAACDADPALEEQLIAPTARPTQTLEAEQEALDKAEAKRQRRRERNLRQRNT